MTTSKRLRTRFPQAYQMLLDVLLGHDPMCIAKVDEYDLEANTILPLLKREHTVEQVHTIVYEQFCYWFSESAGKKSKYTFIAERIHEKVLPLLPESV